MKYVWLILLFRCSVGAQSTCLQTPLGQSPERCEIGNLLVTSSSSEDENIIDEVSCDRNVSSKLFLNLPGVSLRRFNNSGIFSSNETYLLTVVDRTNEKLIWMVSNVSINREEMQVNDSGIILPLAINNTYSQPIIPYHEFNFENKTNLTVEFLIFEERRNNASSSFIETNATRDSPFNLSAWFDAQQSSEITICGPVAGGSVIVIWERTVPKKAQKLPSMDEFFEYAKQYMGTIVNVDDVHIDDKPNFNFDSYNDGYSSRSFNHYSSGINDYSSIGYKEERPLELSIGHKLTLVKAVCGVIGSLLLLILGMKSCMKKSEGSEQTAEQTTRTFPRTIYYIP